MRVLVTGGLGFIGSAVIRHLVDSTEHHVLNLDKRTYAATEGSVAAVSKSPRYSLVEADICDETVVSAVCSEYQPEAIIHLAAETHVDRSIDGPDAFVHTNVLGTMQLLKAAQTLHSSMSARAASAFRFVHVSTDEVFGALTLQAAPFTESSPYSPNSPYAASKAAADHLVRAWHHTHNLPVVITNCSNNYGPFQFPEKLIPLVALKAVAGERIPIYGTGQNTRDWLHVEDHARALVKVLEQGMVGDTYLVGAACERTNIQLAETLCDLIDDRLGVPAAGARRGLIEFVQDRPGHDLRYAIDSSKLERELGWEPRVRIEEGLRDTVDWYLANEAWWEPIVAATYDLGRLGSTK